jgi:hypothetical protein
MKLTDRLMNEDNCVSNQVMKCTVAICYGYYIKEYITSG